ncbi:hypothetical protein BD626DRAFT_412413 [Schizophyllum amplum]|uniref:MYND-type domain-containing protein n=1 Tax=Schizophyllum amplum TaxID=97359 RepID=A0A550BXI6_9AGAR|nr:hypothetical protein BD626DRAFT_412413 [Auriculariopsis ampla]
MQASSQLGSAEHEENIKILGETLITIQQIQTSTSSDSTKEKTIQQHLTIAKRLLRAQPLHFLLDTPPESEDSSGASTRQAAALVTSDVLATLRVLHYVATGNLRYLWPFDVSIWTCVLRWTDHILPIHRDRLLEDMPSTRDDPHLQSLMVTVLGIFDVIASMPKRDVQTYFLSSSNNALCTLVALWALWPTLSEDAERIVEVDLCCARVFYAVWNALEPVVAADVIGAQILRLVGGRHKHVFRIFAWHLGTISAAGERGHTDLRDHIALILPVSRGYELNSKTLPGKVVAVLTAVLDTHLTDAPSANLVWHQALEVLYALCCRSDHAIVLAIEHGLFPLLIRVRDMCAHCSTGAPPFGSEADGSGGVTGGIITLMWDRLNIRRAVKGFQKGYKQYAARIPPIRLRQDEQALLSTAQRRNALLARANEEWPDVAVCCNPACASDKGSPLRACPCGASLYCSTHCQRLQWDSGTHRDICANFIQPAYDIITGGNMRAKDVHFLVVIARDYVESNYAYLTNALPARFSQVIITLRLSHLIETCLNVSPGGAPPRLDGCSFRDIIVRVEYQQGDMTLTRVMGFVPRRAPWRLPGDEFKLLTMGFYGENIDFRGSNCI